MFSHNILLAKREHKAKLNHINNYKTKEEKFVKEN